MFREEAVPPPPEVSPTDVSIAADAPPHPGEVLREDVFPALAMTRKAFAARLGISPRRLSELMNEKAPVTLEVAVRLGVVLGHGARFWLGLQAQHDIWVAERQTAPPLRPIDWGQTALRSKWRSPLIAVYR